MVKYVRQQKWLGTGGDEKQFQIHNSGITVLVHGVQIHIIYAYNL